MNLAFVGYEELSRSHRVLSAEEDNTLLDLLNSSYPTVLFTNMQTLKFKSHLHNYVLRCRQS